MNIYGQGVTGPAGMPLTREMREGGEQQTFRAQEEQTESFIPQAEPAPVQPAIQGNYFSPDEARTRFSQYLPIEATPNDVLLPSDDPRVYTYQMPNGNLYYVPAFEEQLTERRSVGEAIDYAMDILPSRTEVEDALLGAPQAAYNSVRNLVTGQGNYSDMLSTATGMVGANVVPRSRFTEEVLNDLPAESTNDYWDGVEPLDDENAIDTDFEPIGDDPLAGIQWEPEPVQQPPRNPLIPEQITGPVPEQVEWLVPTVPLREGKKPGTGTSPFYPPRDYTPPYEPADTVVFRSPVREIVAGIEIPSQGIKGSQFIKMLQDNPSVRNSEVSALDLGINPQARYTREELNQLVNSRVPQVEGYLTRGYESYQRQKVQDQELGYDELVIEATPQQGKGFRANNQHYGENTLAHTRFSLRDGDNGPYVLVEEMQSDLIQQGWQEPVKRTPSGEPNFTFEDFINQQYVDADEIDFNKFNTIQQIIESAPEDLVSGAMTVDQVARYVANNWPGEVEKPQRYSDIYHSVTEYIDYVSAKNSMYETPPYSNPPIRNTQESTRLLVESLISYADQRGVNEIVFPPLERIAAERFRPGTKDYEKAITPGSGFHQTYVTSLKKVLQELQTEFGRENIPISRRELPYNNAGTLPSISFQDARDDWNDIRLQLNRIVQDNPDENPDTHLRRLVSRLRAVQTEDDNGMLVSVDDFYTSRYGEDYMHAASLESLMERNASMVSPQLPTDGVAIDISALREQYNLQYPRFAEGGLVTQTKQAFGVIA